jgi:hypothetical protein
MKRIERIIQNMIEDHILGEDFICEDCDVGKPCVDISTGVNDSCLYEEDSICPMNILWDNSEKAAEAILNLDCVKQNKILFSALNEEIRE